MSISFKISILIINNDILDKKYLKDIEDIMTMSSMKALNPIEASKIISDEYATKILVATYRRPKSAIRLSQDLGIPIAACYRRIKMLENMKLVRCVERILTQKGKRMSVYISNLKNAYIFFEEGQLRVRFEMKSGIIEDFHANLDQFSSEKIQV